MNKLSEILKFPEYRRLFSDNPRKYPCIGLEWKEPGMFFRVSFIKKEYRQQQESQHELQQELQHELPQAEKTKLSALWHQVSTKSALSQHQVFLLLDACNDPQPVIDLMNIMKWKDRTKFRNKFIKPLIELGLLEMTLPGKPNSSQQKYRATKKGKNLKEYLKRNEK